MICIVHLFLGVWLFINGIWWDGVLGMEEREKK
jgi:hypothetical protein